MGYPDDDREFWGRISRPQQLVRAFQPSDERVGGRLARWGPGEDREPRVWAGKEATAYHPFNNRFPESPNVTVPKLSADVILVLSVGFDSIYTQFLSRREGWGVVNTEYRLHSSAESGLKLFALR